MQERAALVRVDEGAAEREGLSAANESRAADRVLFEARIGPRRLLAVVFAAVVVATLWFSVGSHSGFVAIGVIGPALFAIRARATGEAAPPSRPALDVAPWIVRRPS